MTNPIDPINLINRPSLKLCLSLLILAVWALFGLGSYSAQAGDWSQWRGPARDGHSDDTGLAKQWPEAGPKVAWQVNHVGVGYSSPAVVGDRIITQGDLKGVEHILCLSAKDGSVIWAVQPAPAKAALVEKIEQEFKRADSNGDGVIDEAEALRRFGSNFNKFDASESGDAKAIATKRVARLLKSLDADGDGFLNGAEAAGLMRDDFSRADRADEKADSKALAQKRTDALFKELDKDTDGAITKKEARGSALDRSFNRIDRKPAGKNKDQRLTPAEVLGYLSRYERGKDGQLSADELTMFFTDRYPGRDGILSKAELTGYSGGYRNGQGDGPRGTPTVQGDFVYVEGGNGDVTCLDLKTGKTVWHVNLSKDLGGGRPGWGYSESPLIVDEKLVVTPGGKEGTVVALDKRTGKLIWRSKGYTQGAQYASPILVQIAGSPQIVQFARGAVIGLDAKTGKFLWKYSNPSNGTANCTTPLVFKDHVFGASAYGTGGGLAKITRDTSSPTGFKAQQVYFEKKMANHHGGIVRVGDYMYGFGSGGLICMDFLTGKIQWTDSSVGKGSLIYADGMLYCLGERYQMGLVEANPKEYSEHGRFKIENLGRPSWAHPVVAGGRLYIRNQQRLTTYELRKPAE